jgi:sugar phosphate isomerase/epimerase
MYVAVRDHMLQCAGFGSITEGCKAIGVEAFELAVDRNMQAIGVEEGWQPLVSLETPEELRAYQDALARHGLRVTALLLGNDFSRPDLDEEIAWVIRCARLASQLGAPAVRIDAIMHASGEAWTHEKRIQVFTDSMKRVLETTQDGGIEFGIENHGAIGNDPQFLREVISGAGSPRLGNTLDTANFYWSGKPLSEVHAILKEFAPLTKHTHMKNIAFPDGEGEKERERGWGYAEHCCAVEKGDIDMAKVVGWLRDAGYQNSLCIENESLGRYPEEQRPQILKGEVEFLKGLI